MIIDFDVVEHYVKTIKQQDMQIKSLKNENKFLWFFAAVFLIAFVWRLFV